MVNIMVGCGVSNYPVFPQGEGWITGHKGCAAMKLYTPKNKMNKTEERYSIQLEMLKLSEQIVEWRYEALNFRLAKKTFYMPDFMVVKSDRIEFHEVKGGHWKDDARVKIKVAAQMFPWFKWLAVQWIAGEWRYEEIN